MSTDRMILNPTSIPPLPKPRVRLRCRDVPPPKRNFSISFSLASKNTTTTTNQIRTHLDQLHIEAYQTHTRANSARSRLMRLTEAAENLRRRAAVEVGVGREDDVRELLMQKKKVVQALKKSKKRVELLDDLSAKLIEVTMILYEVLRLYPPVPVVHRHTGVQTKVGDLSIPADVDIILPIILIHHDSHIWGRDAQEFNPKRFSDGVSKTFKELFFPFGTGPRMCPGMNFAMIQAKIVIAMIL